MASSSQVYRSTFKLPRDRSGGRGEEHCPRAGGWPAGDVEGEEVRSIEDLDRGTNQITSHEVRQSSDRKGSVEHRAGRKLGDYLHFCGLLFAVMFSHMHYESLITPRPHVGT